MEDLALQMGTGSGYSYESEGFSQGGALVAYTGSAVNLTRVIIEDNTASFGGGMSIGSLYGGDLATVVITDSIVRRNRAGFDDTDGPHGGGAHLAGTCRLESIRTDWGTGVENNVPNDIATFDGTTVREFNYGADASFVCESSTGMCE